MREIGVVGRRYIGFLSSTRNQRRVKAILSSRRNLLTRFEKGLILLVVTHLGKNSIRLQGYPGLGRSLSAGSGLGVGLRWPSGPMQATHWAASGPRMK
jgi:hypothetical protein